ncbi:uncharacterized protein LOC120333172 isoform X1 [Styela clava]
MSWISIIVVIIISFGNGNLAEKLDCQFKRGCIANGCDPLPLWNKPGSNVKEYLKRKEFPITCDMKNKASNDVLKLYADNADNRQEMKELKQELDKLRKLNEKQRKEIKLIKSQKTSSNNQGLHILKLEVAELKKMLESPKISSNDQDLLLLKQEIKDLKKIINTSQTEINESRKETKNLLREINVFRVDMYNLRQVNKDQTKEIEKLKNELDSQKPSPIDINPCSTVKCQRNRKCSNVNGKGVCKCAPGYTLQNNRCVGILRLPCTSNPCHKLADCQNVGSSQYRCECKKPYVGDGISVCRKGPQSFTSIGTFPCSNQCHKQAECENVGSNRYQCRCKKPYIGNGMDCRTELPIGPCLSNLCHEHAECEQVDFHRYKCTCKKPYTGDGRNCKVGDGQLRIVGGNSDKEGRVEIYYHGEWGTFCDDHWDMKDANVVCRTLGFKKATSALKGALFGKGSGRIWIYVANCKGTENTFSECNIGIQNIGKIICYHGKGASVICE